jgi:hypothetical protein
MKYVKMKFSNVPEFATERTEKTTDKNLLPLCPNSPSPLPEMQYIVFRVRVR